MSALFDWCGRGQHSKCRRTGQVLVAGVGKAAATTREIVCGCDDAHCPCAKNPRPGDVQKQESVV